MKKEIVKVSPLLLIDGKRTELPVLPNQKNKDFNTFFTIGAESLLYTYCAVLTVPTNIEVINFIEEIRLLRNKIIHSVLIEELYPKNIITLILSAFTHFLGQGSWWNAFREQSLNHPSFGNVDKHFEESSLHSILDYVEMYLGINKLNKHFTNNLKNRRYYCPNCIYGLAREDEEIESKWAYLYPNEVTSTNVLCLNCQKISNVTRKPCLKERCKGNVIYNNYCLTCLYDQNDV